MESENLAVSVNPKARGYGNTEATRESGESVETAREAPRRAGEDTVRPSVKAEEADRNDRPARKGGNRRVRGEEEIAFDARPSVYTGHFQRVTDLLA